MKITPMKHSKELAEFEARPNGHDAPLYRDDLLVSAWLNRELPPRDYLLGDVLCTTSRWLIIGETGVGKTLFALELAAAIAAGADALGWKGRRKARVMYLDGELPAETFKERIGIIAAQYGDDIELFGYNRDVLSEDDMPPLNTPEGAAWLMNEIDNIQPDIIFFDSVMCLINGVMSDEESWTPINAMARVISSRRIAQVWLHHTGHDATRGFGTKTREWKMDTVAMLSKREGDDEPEGSAAFQLEFTKKRLCNPSNFTQFATKIVRRTPDGFTFEAGKKRAASERGNERGKDHAILSKAFLDTYERLADSVKPQPGLDGKPVKKVSVDAIRDDLKDRGRLEADDKGQIASHSRQALYRVKQEFIAKQILIEAGGSIWRISMIPVTG